MSNPMPAQTTIELDNGRVKLYCGDMADVLKSLESKTINAFIADPPYGHNNHDGDFNDRLNEHRGIESQPIENDSPEEFRRIMDLFLDEVARLATDDSCCCCCCCCGGGGPKPTFAWLANRMDSRGLQFFHSVIWDKLNPGLGWRYRRQHEMILVSHLEGGKLRWAKNDLAVPNVIRMSPPKDRLHPNEKPEGLMNKFIVWHTFENDLVCDPFMGSGTTGVSAIKLGRRFIGIEKDERHFEIALKRIEQAILQPSLFNV